MTNKVFAKVEFENWEIQIKEEMAESVAAVKVEEPVEDDGLSNE